MIKAGTLELLTIITLSHPQMYLYLYKKYIQKCYHAARHYVLLLPT